MRTLQEYKEKDIAALSHFLFAFYSGEGTHEFLEKNLMNMPPDKLSKAIYSHGLDTLAMLTDSVMERNRASTMDFYRQLTEEYDCQTPSEKALAQVAANAYMRVMEASHTFVSAKNLTELGPIRNGYYGMMSKELDRANRHFISALTLLKQMKAPPLKINIKTNNAFIAKNQVNIDKHENIEPK